MHFALWYMFITSLGVVPFLILYKLIALHFRNTLVGQAYLTVL